MTSFKFIYHISQWECALWLVDACADQFEASTLSPSGTPLKHTFFWTLVHSIFRPCPPHGISSPPPPPPPPPPLKYVTNRVFSVHTISNVTSFFRAEKSLPNFQCGPLTRLVRGIYLEDNYGLLHGYRFSGPFSISLILRQESAVLKRRTVLFLR